MAEFGFVKFLVLGFAGLQVSPAVLASDVSVYTVRKGLEYTQSDAGIPSLHGIFQ